MKEKFLTMLLAFMLSMTAFAQKINCTGTVLDEQGEPVIGASVVQKGNSTVGTVTDLDGRFTLSVDPGSTLVISYIGYDTREVKASAGGGKCHP